MVVNGPKWFQMVINGQERSKTVSNGHKMTQHDPNWPEMTKKKKKNVPEWFGTVSKWLKLA
jgi:outer membrane lipoprotein-sorting protein